MSEEQSLGQLLNELLSIPSWPESKRFVAAHPELLSPRVDELIARGFKEIPPPESEFLGLILRQQILGRCREAGIDAAFEDLLSDAPALEIFQFLNKLTAPEDAPRHLLTVFNLLMSFPLDGMPSVWGMVVDDLGRSLLSTRLGDQEANVERAIVEFCNALTARTRSEMPAEWAETQYNLATAFSLRYRGDRDQNLETAIGLCEQALEVQRSAVFSAARAKTLGRLAKSWFGLRCGDREEQLDKAVRFCEEALHETSQEVAEDDWIELALDLVQYRQQRRKPEDLEQVVSLLERLLFLLEESGRIKLAAEMANDLAGAYLQRVAGNRGENQERAIGLFEKVLKHQTSDFPERLVLYNLSIAYRNRIAGNRSQNLDRALALCEQALAAPSEEVDGVEPARLQALLASLHQARQGGDRAEATEQALAAAEAARQLVGSDPVVRLKAQIAAGNAYFFRAREDREENLRLAAEAFEKGLWEAPQDAADRPAAQIFLAHVYTQQEGPGREDRLELALAACREALKVRRREVDPFGWAEAMHALGEVYNWRSRDGRALNLKKAIEAFRSALAVRTAEAEPVKHVETMAQLAGVLRDLSHHCDEEERSANLYESVRVHRQALEVADQGVMPEAHRNLQGNLGRLFFELMNWRGSADAMQAALATSERLYQASATPEGKLAELHQAMELPPRIAYCLARVGEPAQALEALEGNRARLLAESLDLGQAELRKATPEDQTAFGEGLRTIAGLETEVRSLGPEQPAAFVDFSTKIRAARQGLSSTVERIRSYVPEFLPAGLDRSAVASLTRRAGQTLVFLVSSPHGSLALLIQPGERQPESIELDFSSFELRGLLFGEGGMPGYIAGLTTGSRQERKEAVDRVTRRLTVSLVEPLEDALVRRGCREVTLVPCGMLGLLPLPALLSERLAISLIPSARAWRAAIDAVEARSGAERRFLAVDNPTGDLDSASAEIDAIESRFSAGSHRRLCGSQVTKAELISAARGATHLHFACHGIYRPIRPLESALLLAGSETLTVRDLLDGALDLSASRLAVLSACETGVFDVRTAPDEVLGLPAGLLQAGVPGVVSSLWRVDDMATSLLMSRFYQGYLHGDPTPLPPAQALRKAQLWLRDVTKPELSLLCEDAERRPAGESFLSPKAASRLGFDLAFEDDASRPYSDPYFWAPFVFMGA